jgi:hypothetical protein
MRHRITSFRYVEARVAVAGFKPLFGHDIIVNQTRVAIKACNFLFSNHTFASALAGALSQPRQSSITRPISAQAGRISRGCPAPSTANLPRL